MVFGKAHFHEGRLNFTHPEFWEARENETDYLGVFPVYPPLGGKGLAAFGPLLRLRAMDRIAEDLKTAPALLPKGFLKEHNLLDPTELIGIIHKPPNRPGPLPRPRESRAFGQLSLLELCLWRLMLLWRREKDLLKSGKSREKAQCDLCQTYLSLLPFLLSPEQKRVIEEIEKELRAPRPLSRLIQGEVGCGKTAVAGALIFRALSIEGQQAALMAPTELLASQHHDFFQPLAQSMGLRAALLTGSLSPKESRAALEGLSDGSIHLAIGTQAIISGKTKFRNLSLAVIDEQHRFGVKQRLALRKSFPGLDLVALSATPIPRSLALALYGDMDISSLSGTLPGRLATVTEIFSREKAREAYLKFVGLIAQGEQGFLISPRIGSEYESLADLHAQDDPFALSPWEMEGSNGLEELSASRDGGDSQKDIEKSENEKSPPARGPSLGLMERRLLAAMAGLSIMGRNSDKSPAPLGPSPGGAQEISYGVIHGRMKREDLDKTMEEFRSGRIKVLIATTLVEVGVDVPGANLMLMEGADYFGLAQLHQLRGRIGRGGGQGRLFLVPSSSDPGPKAIARFEALRSGKDGYALAELDLALRGPGEEMGLRQSGWPQFDFASLPKDLPRLSKALELAEKLMGQKEGWPPALEEGLAELAETVAEEPYESF
jgi:ATP-dependent DNA helicase RecG